MRRAAHEALTKKAVQSYHPILMKEATILVSSLLTPSATASLSPDKQFQRLAASTIMSIVYDYPTIISEHDDAIEKIEEYILRVGHAATPEAYFVNIFHWMVHIPARSWCLLVISSGILTHDQTRFAKWKREGFRQYNEDYAMFRGLLNRVRADLVCACLSGSTLNPTNR